MGVVVYWLEDNEMKIKIKYNVLVFKEGDTYVAYTPQLDLSSCGATTHEARKMLDEAMGLFLEEAERMGTLEDVLQESNYDRDEDQDMWVPPTLVEIATAETL
jgi:predicted RNase H-like HicB family nuclease